MLHLLATTYRSDKRKCSSFLIIELCSQVVKTVSVQKESFLLAAEQALSHICKGYKSQRNVI